MRPELPSAEETRSELKSGASIDHSVGIEKIMLCQSGLV